MKAKISLSVGIAILFALFFIVPGASAQVTEEDSAAGLENCFLYYDYGKVAVNLATNKPYYKTGETAQIIGTITNENTFPLVDVVVYAQLRRTNNPTAAVTQGHYLLERKIITQPLNLLPNETRSISAEFPLFSQYPRGSYELQYFVFSQKGFHYAGRPFLEEDYAGKSLFDIQDSAAPLAYIDLATLQVNALPVAIRGPVVEFTGETLRFTASIADARNQKSDIAVMVKYYSFEDAFEENLIASESITVSPSTGKIETSFSPPASGAYVMVMRMETPTVSELKYRFAKVGGKKQTLRINDLGVTSYLATASAKAFVCMHSPARDETPLTTVTLQILDNSKNVVTEKTVSREFSGDVLAVSLPFDSPRRDFWVQTIVRWKDESGDQTKTSQVHYACDTFQSSPADLKALFQSASSVLAISATNLCGEIIQSGGYIESIRILNENGETVKEQYNIPSITQNISMADLPDGNYTARVKSGAFDQEVPFILVGSATKGGKAKNFWVIIAIVSLILLFTFAIVYIKRKRKRI